MEFEQTFANHSEPVASEPTETLEQLEQQEPTQMDETPVNETDEPSSPPQEEEGDYFEVKYNKEILKIPREEAPTYIQKGLNYDKIKQRAEELEKTASYLDKLAQLSGYQSTEEFIRAVEQAEEQRRIEEEARKFGIDPEVYRQHFELVNAELQQLRAKLNQLEQERAIKEVEREVNELRSKYEDFEKYEEKVFELAIQKGYALEDAYKLVAYEDHISKVMKQTEQEVLAKVRGRDQKQVLPSNDRPNHAKLDPANMTFEQIEELSRRARMGERITF
jgi:hypothetical protein